LHGRYPMALGTLADMEEMNPTSGRPGSLALYSLAVDNTVKYCEDLYVYPYTYIGNYYYRHCQFKNALKYWAAAAQVISMYVLHTSLPVCLFNLPSVYTPVCCLCSSSLLKFIIKTTVWAKISHNLLSKPLYKLKASQPAFSFASPSVWNDLSEFVNINIFKCRFKTELFSRYD